MDIIKRQKLDVARGAISYCTVTVNCRGFEVGKARESGRAVEVSLIGGGRRRAAEAAMGDSTGSY